MAPPTDDALREILLSTAPQPMPAPSQWRAWEVHRLVSEVQQRHGGQRDEIEQRLDDYVASLGGRRVRQEIANRSATGPRRPAWEAQPDHYEVDENVLDPSLRPESEGWVRAPDDGLFE